MKTLWKGYTGLGLLLAFLVIGQTARAQIQGVALPADFFTYTISGNGETADGNFYMAYDARNNQEGTALGYLIVMDNAGDVQYFRRAPENQVFVNFTPFPDANMMTFCLGTATNTVKQYVMDNTYTLVDSVEQPEDMQLDGHECLLRPDGTLWLEYMKEHPFDFSQVIEGGNPDGILLTHVIQHLDTDHSVLWSWDSWDHLDELPLSNMDDTTRLLDDETEHLHTNAFAIDTDGNLLVSNRRESEVVKVKVGDGDGHQDGDVLWHLGGGISNEFTFTDDGAFSEQHDIRRWPNGHITVFDNGMYHDPPNSYGREYELDEENMTATLVYSFDHDTSLYARATGSHRILPNGNHLIGWGLGTPVGATETTAEGATAWEINLPMVMGSWPHSYRYYKSTMTATAALPYLVALPTDGGANLYLNFFGHDDVASYDIYIAEGDGDETMLMNATDNVVQLDNLTNGTAYSFRIVARDMDDNESGYSNRETVTPAVNAVTDPGLSTMPDYFVLEQNYPNPFNPETTIRVRVNHAAPVTITVYNTLGRQVSTLNRGVLSAGSHRFSFDGRGLASGIYFVRADAPGVVSQTRRMILLH